MDKLTVARVEHHGRDVVALGDDQALYAALVASLSDMGEGLMIIENRRFTYVNQALAQLTGYRKSEILSWPTFILLFPLDQQPQILDNHLRRLAGETFTTCYETRLQHRAGHAVDVEISVARLETPARKGVVITVRDITFRKLAEAEIRQKNQALEQLTVGLEHKVRERTAALQAANQQLTRLNQVKSDFLAVVSHELRTPLTAIKSFTEILQDEVAEQDVAACQRYLQIVSQETDRLTRLITDLLDLQKIDAGTDTWRGVKVSLVELVRQVCATLGVAFRERGLALEVVLEQPELWVRGEPDRLQQVLENLLANALKFTRQGGVRVTLRLVEDEAGQPLGQVLVTDTGIGIPAEMQARVFERFFQVDATQSRQFGGAGLGLAIAQEITRQHGGELRLHSSPGEGSTFTLCLPVPGNG